jgi:hypothetical protein
MWPGEPRPSGDNFEGWYAAGLRDLATSFWEAGEPRRPGRLDHGLLITPDDNTTPAEHSATHERIAFRLGGSRTRLDRAKTQ